MDAHMFQQVIRATHVEQAKGHLRAALATFYSNDDYEVCEAKISEFIKWLEEEAPGIA